ncbi:glycosyltransferase [Terribacillus sp. DMT04]|uniref:glycosyltransferase n=1 Tax=Terribacillus sp. DMT04 TaxID=2850441 RepID=UPI001C2BE50B|nr:glycosyltransferase [Terribacillus sp. DMT04]QXE01066.1 multidrug MFS transporter [Terribacillus sp. DMT04]
MIFVTVGTHEQPFDRLIKEIDSLKGNKAIKEDIFIQTGYSTYIPQHCSYKKLLSYEEMNNRAAEANIVITHGGPASIMLALQHGKIPLVVPREKKHNEHVNDHQVEFCDFLSHKSENIIWIRNLKELNAAIYNAPLDNFDFTSNNTKFNDGLEKIVEKLYI